MRMMPRATPSAIRDGARGAGQNNGITKSEPKYLACEESPIIAFYF